MSGWEGFAKYCGIQGVLALLVTIFLLVFIYIGTTVPDQIWTLLGLSWGFYFAKNGVPIVTARLQK